MSAMFDSSDLPGGVLSPARVAAVVGVAPVTVRRWCERGELEAVRLGSGRNARYRITRESFAAFLRRSDAPASVGLEELVVPFPIPIPS